MPAVNNLALPLVFEAPQGVRRREAARLHDKVVELRRAGFSVYRVGERQVIISFDEHSRLLSHGEFLRLDVSLG